MSFQSTFTPTAGENERRFSFKYCAETRARTKFNQIICKNAEVIIGCFDETKIESSAKTLPALAAGERQSMFRYDELDGTWQVPRENSTLKIHLHKELFPNVTAGTENYTTTYYLNQYIQWSTDIANCYASNITLCEDENCATVIQTNGSAKAYLAVNPTNKNITGWVEPILHIDRRAPFSMYLYLQATNNAGTIKNVFKINCLVCG